jgi:hypothetical protein
MGKFKIQDINKNFMLRSMYSLLLEMIIIIYFRLSAFGFYILCRVAQKIFNISIYLILKYSTFFWATHPSFQHQIRSVNPIPRKFSQEKSIVKSNIEPKTTTNSTSLIKQSNLTKIKEKLAPSLFRSLNLYQKIEYSGIDLP